MFVRVCVCVCVCVKKIIKMWARPSSRPLVSSRRAVCKKKKSTDTFVLLVCVTCVRVCVLCVIGVCVCVVCIGVQE